jgi:serine/threonine protein kinase/formylglycine-generating enzyme required for sulfatase activity
MQERELFLSALEIEDLASRRAYLESACAGDSDLLAGVQLLLQLHEKQSQFLNSPVVEQLTDGAFGATALFASTGGDECEAAEFSSDASDPMWHDDEVDIEVPQGYLQPSSNADSLGRLAHYEIFEVLGRGAFGIVLKAFDEKLRRVVAIKVLAPELAATSPARKRFLREARNSAAIRHENVVNIYNVDEIPIPYLVMEYIPGQTLQQRLDEHGPLDLPDVLRLGKQIADGLAAAHAQELIHRDVKPGNILLETGINDRVKITDFGLARTADDASVTQSGMIAGTPLYMAPEQVLGHKLDPRADLFSFGSVLYQMLTGRPPFRAANTVAVLKRVSEDTPRPIQEIIPEVPEWMCEIVARLHEKNADDRYTSAREVGDLLDHCLTEFQQGRIPHVPDSKSKPGRSAAQRQIQRQAATSRLPSSFLLKAAAVVLILLAGLAVTEAIGVTRLSSTVIRLTTGSGTLVVETDDPNLKLAIDGKEVTIHGAGIEELTLRPGDYRIAALKDGKPVKQELVTITRNGRTVVRMSLERAGDPGASLRPAQVFPPGNYALELDGDGDHVLLPTLSYKGDKPVTFEARVRIAEGHTNLQRIVACTWGGLAVLPSGKLRFAAWNSAEPGQKIELVSPSAIRRGADTHIAVSWDGVEYSLFVNGERVAHTKDRAFEIVRGTGFTFGADSADQADGFLHGRIDEVRISNTARYAGDFTPEARFEPDQHTLALYHFDEGQGDVLNDASGNRHHGKIVGATWVHSARMSLGAQAFPWPADTPPPAIAPFNVEQARQHQQAWADALGIPFEFTNGIEMEFVLIPPGEFTMGSPPAEIASAIAIAIDDEQLSVNIQSATPQHKVILTRPIYLSVHEVTQSQFETVMGTNPSAFAATGVLREKVENFDTQSFPVESVSWNDAAEFCAKLSEKERLKPCYLRRGETVTLQEGTGYRLPTEAEWEFACRAGTTSKYSSGDNSLSQVAWWGQNADGRTHAVGELEANPFGLFDMHGNVWEFVQDEWGVDYYGQFADKPAIDPTGASSSGSQRVVRGGRWTSDWVGCRSSTRFGYDAATHSEFHTGFRIAMTVDAVKQALKIEAAD